ncbi:MAG TPA: S53 family peptidase [Alphaproteobacteria bacterium]|jgi:subtilase family serine protease|nr:S53 family peptidase [Alphaproteobacteria bacterium]
MLSVLIGLVLAFAAIAPAWAEEGAASRSVVVDRIDENQRVTLAGNTRARLRDLPGVKTPDTTRLEHIHMQLRSTPEREQAAETYIEQLTEPNSANYHKWLTADEFGSRFGAAEADIAKVTAWLKSKGFAVNHVYPNRLMIDFSGNAGQVLRAFNAEIDKVVVNGANILTNTHDPQVPAALAPVVDGIVSLNNFRPHATRSPRPAVTAPCSTPCQAVGPGDMATIYGLSRLFQAHLDGRGQTIAVVEPSNLYSVSDWNTFRRVFRLTSHTTGRLTTSHPAAAGGAACDDPGVQAGDDAEAALDAEWATAAAPGAIIRVASCASTSATSGVFIALQHLVNAKAPPQLISVSWAVCEAENGAAMNAAFNRVYQQAAAQGISVFVASGDSGASGCAPGPGSTSSGIGVNGMGDSRYAVSVGGTDFSDTYSGTTSRYWKANAGAPWSTAKSYIPEIPWNDNCASVLVAQFYGGTSTTYGADSFCNAGASGSFQTLSAGGGGPSRCYSGTPSVSGQVSGTCKGFPKPNYQKGFPGMPADGVRDTPDVSLFAADGVAWGHAYATCFTDQSSGGGPCTGNPQGWAGNSGGTSYGAPIMAGIHAILNQHKGQRQGNPLPVYYSLAKRQYGKAGNPNCYADKGNTIGTNCIFHDIVRGDVDVYCDGTVSCLKPSGTYGVLSLSDSAYLPAYKAQAGYDLATGIGSVNAYNLVANWP